LALTPIEGRQR